MAMNLKSNKYILRLKQGLQDMKTVAQEGNFKLFLKQGIAILVIFLLFRFVSGKNQEQMEQYEGEIKAIETQQTSEQEYLRNKELLLKLEPLFPDISSKNEWMMSQILSIFKDAKLDPTISSGQSEDTSNPTYTLARMEVSTNAAFPRFAEFLATIENREEFLKVSSFTLKKDPSTSALGNNQISMRFNTIFPKEKIASRLFKDAAKSSKKDSKADGEKK